MTIAEFVAAAVGTVAAVAMVVAIWTIDFGQ